MRVDWESVSESVWASWGPPFPSINPSPLHSDAPSSPSSPQAISKAAADLGDMDLSHLLLDTTELRKGLGASLDDKLIRDLQVVGGRGRAVKSVVHRGKGWPVWPGALFIPTLSRLWWESSALCRFPTPPHTSPRPAFSPPPRSFRD